MKYVDTAALAVEVLHSRGLRAMLYPSSNETASKPIVVVQDAGPVNIRESIDGLGTNTVISLSVVAETPTLCAQTADAAVAALVDGYGQYKNGRLVSGKAVNLPRPVGQNVLARENLYQRHAMIKIIARNITKG